MIGSWCLLPTFNDGFGDMGSNAVNRLLQMQGNAASAIAATAQGRFVRKADLWAECSAGLLPAIPTSGGVAAKLRFRVCSGGHAGAYGADVVKDIFWILNK